MMCSALCSGLHVLLHHLCFALPLFAHLVSHVGAGTTRERGATDAETSLEAFN